MSPKTRGSNPGSLALVFFLSALLLSLFGTSCVSLKPATPNAAGVVHATVTLGATVDVQPDPFPVCFVDPHCPTTNEAHWDLFGTTGKLEVHIELSPTGICKFTGNPYDRDPDFRIQCPTDTQCITVGRPAKKGCYKYSVTVTPSGGAPKTIDPDMIIM